MPVAIVLSGVAAGTALAAIVAVLLLGMASGPVDWSRLLTSAVWDPARRQFGATAMLWGTAAVSLVALLIAAPVGWAAAVAVVELAPPRCRRALRAASELLAVVPSIVYGLIGIAYIRPLVSRLGAVPGGDSLLAAGLVLAVMILPTIVAVSANALDDVPWATQEAAAACGLTRREVIRSAVLPAARRGMGAGALLGLARALGETIAVFLLVGRADGRVPSSPGDLLTRLVRPGQTLTTKLNGPESVLAGTSGAHWAALCALGLLLLLAVVTLTVLAQRRATMAGAHVAAHGRWARGQWSVVGTGHAAVGIRARQETRVTGAARGRRARDRGFRLGLWAALGLVLLLVAAVAVAVVSRGGAAFDPRFWWRPAAGASGGGVRDQLMGTILVVAVAGALAAPVGLGLGLLMAEYAPPRTARWLRALTLTLGGVPSILLGLWGYWLFATRLGWGRSWLTGAIVLALVAVPPVVIAVAAALAALPAERRETALGLGLKRVQLVRWVLMPHALPGLVTGLLLGLARAAGETAPLLFTAAVFSGAPTIPSGVRDAPVAALPTHIFTLAQDAAGPAAPRAAWGAAVVLVVVAGLLVLLAVPARRRLDRWAS